MPLPLVDEVPPVRGRPGRPRRRPGKPHADKAYDVHRIRQGLTRRHIKVRIARRAIESSHHLGRHRWVIERSLSWLTRFRHLVRRYDRTATHFAAFVTISCTLIAYQPPRATVICGDELGPVIPRTFAPAPGWSPGGHRIKAPLEYSRGSQKTWVYGGLRVRDGQEVTFCAPSRNAAGRLRLLREIARTNPRGQVYVIADNLSSHTSAPIRRWLRKHPGIHQVFIPVGACWLNLAEGWWRIFRKTALAGRSFADPDEIDQATRLATTQLNSRANPWVWGRPPPPHRRLRRKFVYLL